MAVQLKKILSSEKPFLKNLLSLYIHDLSEFVDLDINAEGSYTYPWLDSYWEESNRHPFFIMVDNEVAGFVLVNQIFKILKDSNGHALAEFFILRKFRRKEIGRQAAMRTFQKFSGAWEVSVINNNVSALHFWEKIIGFSSDQKMEKIPFESNGDQKTVFIFKS